MDDPLLPMINSYLNFKNSNGETMFYIERIDF